MENMWQVLTQKQKLEAFRLFAKEEKAMLEEQKKLKIKIAITSILLIISLVVLAISLN